MLALRIPLVAVLATLFVPVFGSAQVGPDATVFLGRVLEPGGAPAVGAVVVSSAGGKAVTDGAGEFALEVDLAPDIERVMLTAAGAGSRSAGAAVAALARGGSTPAGTLQLKLGAGCDPAWLPTFGEKPGVNNWVEDLLVFDAGDGPALYVAGGFSVAGSNPAVAVAKWDGETWSAVGSLEGQAARALAVFDDGSGDGPQLYVGGSFLFPSTVQRLDGNAWTPLPTPVGDFSFPGDVNALEVFDDGGGAALYAGGSFFHAGTANNANNIAKWNGTSWSGLASGVLDSGPAPVSVQALEVFDGSLYVGGRFDWAGGVAVEGIARWSGSAWSAVGGSVTDEVHALTVHDDGSGSRLFVGGQFSVAGTANVATWDGANWAGVGGTNGVVDDFIAHDGALFAAGTFTLAGGQPVQHVARWDGAGWTGLGVQFAGGGGRALASFDGRLYVGGSFTLANGSVALHVGSWADGQWSVLGAGVYHEVRAMTMLDGDLYVAGQITMAGGQPTDLVARWDGASWSPLEGGTVVGAVNALAVFDGALHAGGFFQVIGSDPHVENIARWDGAQWQPLGPGLGNVIVKALAVYDAGPGPSLLLVGKSSAPGPLNTIDIWNGASWSAAGPGVTGEVHALLVFDGELVVGGDFDSAGLVPADNVARWDGGAWAPLAGGTNGRVHALAVHDDGGGATLYAGGEFTSPGARVAKWDGAAWSALGAGVGSTSVHAVDALLSHDDGSGRGAQLFVGGHFETAGRMAANYIARWDGASWSPLGGGMADLPGFVTSVQALAAYQGSLVAGGLFQLAVDSGDSYVARWGCPSPWSDLGFALAGAAGPPLLAGTGPLVEATAGALTLSDAASSATALLFVSVASRPAPFKGGTLVPVPVTSTLPLVTSGTGGVTLAWPSWPAGLSGLELHFQVAIVDGGAPVGVALSNALVADVP
jgi:hypothetical protein